MPKSRGIKTLEERFCKYCKRPYKMTAAGHALHLRAHLRKMMKPPTPDPQPKPQAIVLATPVTPQTSTQTLNPLACPECAAQGIEKIFGSAIGRGHHRSQVHGYRGPNYDYYQKMKKNKRAIVKHARESEHANGNGKSPASHIIEHEIATAFAAGYVKRSIDQFAESRNVPAALFAQGVWQLVLDSTGGQAMGPQVRLPNMRRSTP